MRVAFSYTVAIEPGDAAGVEELAADQPRPTSCPAPNTSLADAVARLVLGPLARPTSRFPLQSCSVEETTDEFVVTSSGTERRARNSVPSERLVILQFEVWVRDRDLPTVQQYAATRYGIPIRLESAVFDLLDEPVVDAPFAIIDYSFRVSEPSERARDIQ